MKCPKCGCEDFAYVETTDEIIRPKLPLWIGIIPIITGWLFLMVLMNLENGVIKYMLMTLFALIIFFGIAYLFIRYVRIRNDRRKIVTKRICKQCNHIDYI